MSATLRISVGANVVLAGIVVVLLWRDRPAAPPAIAPIAPPTTTVRAEALQSRSVPDGLAPAAFAQLERMGISREGIVSALLEDFHRRWDQRLADLEKKHAPQPAPERDHLELARLRDAEKIRVLKEALGEEGYVAWDKDRTLRLLNGAGVPLSAAEAERAYRLHKEFDRKHRELQMAMEDGVADMADGSKLQAQAQEALDRELEKLLGRQRLDAMRGLGDPRAEVQGKYGDLNPTADQVNAVLLAEANHRARETALAQRLKENPGDAASVVTELKAMHEAREENLRRVFGAAAYDTSKRLNDPRYKTLQHYAAAWGLEERDVQSVYESLRAWHEQVDRTRGAAALSEAAGRRVNGPELDAAIDQARQQTEAGLQNLIGGERLRRLQQNGLLTSR